MGRQNSMSYPGQGSLDGALGSSQDKAKLEGRPPGRSKPSTQENNHRTREQTADHQPKKGRSS